VRDAPIKTNDMARPRSKYPPQTPAERQAKCRAIKRGEQVYLPDMTDSEPLEDRPLPNATNPNHTLAWLRKQPAAMQQSIASQLGLPAPADSGGQSAALPAPELPATRALPAPQQAIELRQPDRPCRGGAPFALASIPRQPAGAAGGAQLALPDPDQPEPDAQPAAFPVSLPSATVARLRSLIHREATGKPMTVDERVEALASLDLAEYLVIQRLRRRFAA